MVHRIKWLFLFRLSRNIIYLTFYFLHFRQSMKHYTKSITFPYMRDVCIDYYICVCHEICMPTVYIGSILENFRRSQTCVIINIK